MSERNLEKIIICFDSGSSLLKILYRRSSERVKYMAIEPEHLVLPPESATYLPVEAGMGKSEDNAWIRYKKNDKCHVIGRVARDYQSSVNFKALKCETVAPKIMAAIGAIAERENMEDEFRVDLGVLLPWDEIQLRERLYGELKISLRSFYFRNKRLQVNLERYMCVPEASGTAMWLSKNDRDFQNINEAYLMFGHRNTTLLFFRRGSISGIESGITHLGYVNLIEQMRKKIPGLKAEKIILAMKTSMKSVYDSKQEKYSYEMPQTVLDWSALAREPVEAHKLASAYETSAQEAWQVLSNWLVQLIPSFSEIERIVSCGGVYPFLIQNLKKFFEKSELYVPEDYIDELFEALELNKASKIEEAKRFILLNLPLRFVDVWGLFVVFSGYQERLTLSLVKGNESRTLPAVEQTGSVKN